MHVYINPIRWFSLISKRDWHFSQSKLLQPDRPVIFLRSAHLTRKEKKREKEKEEKTQPTIYLTPSPSSRRRQEHPHTPSETTVGLHARSRSGCRAPSTSREPQRRKLESPTQIARHLDPINPEGAAVTWRAIGRAEAVATDAATSTEFVGDQDSWRRRGRRSYWCVCLRMCARVCVCMCPWQCMPIRICICRDIMFVQAYIYVCIWFVDVHVLVLMYVQAHNYELSHV